MKNLIGQHANAEIATMSGNKRRQSKAEKPPSSYQPTERERVVIDKQRKRRAEQPPAPKAKVRTDGGRQEVAINHIDIGVGLALLMEALGTSDVDFAMGLLNQLGGVSTHNGRVSEVELNFILSIIKDIKPDDQLVAMLAAQMAVVHITLMKVVPGFFTAEALPQQEFVDRALNKLARTFTTQMEALKRYRTGGEQKVTVQHVSVGEGGQAIVGNVTQTTKPAATEKATDAPPALTDARQAAMPPITNQGRVPLPVKRRRKDER